MEELVDGLIGYGGTLFDAFEELLLLDKVELDVGF